MEMDIQCPACSMTLTVEDSAAGTQLKCPRCSTLLVVPTVVTAPAESRATSITSGAGDEQLAEKLANSYRIISAEVAKAIVGQDKVIEQIIIAIFARSHCLLEGVPGLAKTFMISTLSKAMDLSFKRVQFTPDLMPSDITGTEVIQQDAEGRRSLVFLQGPIFAQLVLADEINRSPPKTQAALLEAMQEHSVTTGGQTHKLSEPFFVLATQNPIEQEGTYALPEAQRDRFMFHIRVDYPNRNEEAEIIKRQIENLGRLEMRLVAIEGYRDNGVNFDLTKEKERLEKWLDTDDAEGAKNRAAIARYPERIDRYNNLLTKDGGRLETQLRWFPRKIRAASGPGNTWDYSFSQDSRQRAFVVAVFGPGQYGAPPPAAVEGEEPPF